MGAVTSTKVGAFGARFGLSRRAERDLLGLPFAAGWSPPSRCSASSRHFQYDSVDAFSPVSVASSFAVRPLSFHRSTRFAQSARQGTVMVRLE